MTASPCRKCGMALTADIQYCPLCGTPNPYSDVAPSDPTDSSTVPSVSQQNLNGPSDPYEDPFQALPPAPAPARTRLIIGVLIGIIVLLVLMGIIGALAFTQKLGVTQTNATATGKAQINATATAQAQARLHAAATVTAVVANLAVPACKYMYWPTGVNTDKSLTNFGVPQGCVMVLDSVSGSLNGVTLSNGEVVTLPTVSWNNGGVMAFSPGVYSGDISNGEYEIVPEKAKPNPKQVFCNRVQYVVSHGYAFTQAQPLPAWGLSGPKIVAQGHC